MSELRTYAFLNARIRTIRSSLLTKPVYKELISAKDVHDLQVQLSKTHFKAVFERAGVHDTALLEQAFFLDELGRIRIIEEFSQDKLRSFIQCLLQRYEAEKIKILLRLWHRRTDLPEILIPEKILYAIPANIVDAADLKEFTRALADTPYAEPLRAAESDFTAYRSVFPLELAVDRTVFENLLKSSAALSTRDHSMVKRLVGIEIDISNLNWIGRFKRYYHLSSAEIGRLLLPNGFRIRQNKIRQIAAEGNLIQALMDIFQGAHLNIPDPQNEVLVLGMLERFFSQVLRDEAVHAFAGFPFSIGAVLGYFYLIRMETRNVRMLFESKKYTLTPQQAEDLLVV